MASVRTSTLRRLWGFTASRRVFHLLTLMACIALGLSSLDAFWTLQLLLNSSSLCNYFSSTASLFQAAKASLKPLSGWDCNSIVDSLYLCLRPQSQPPIVARKEKNSNRKETIEVSWVSTAGLDSPPALPKALKRPRLAGWPSQELAAGWAAPTALVKMAGMNWWLLPSRMVLQVGAACSDRLCQPWQPLHQRLLIQPSSVLGDCLALLPSNCLRGWGGNWEV